VLREGADRAVRRVVNAGHMLGHAAGRTEEGRERLVWLLVATLPNSGSTALADLLAGAPNAVTLTPTGEGVWLLPSLTRREARRDGATPASMLPLRLAWVRRALFVAPPEGDVVVVEKSPWNLVRFRRVHGMLGGMRRRTIRLYRDPYAICASWAKRYKAGKIGRAADRAEREERFFRLGRDCAAQFRMLEELGDLARLTLRYEDVVADPASALAALRRAVPELGPIDAGAAVRVKDYAPQPLRDMNEAQIATLRPEDLAGITRALEPVADLLAARGYEVRRDA
jgi:hypothetical protein